MRERSMCARDSSEAGADAAKLSHMVSKPLRVLLIQSWVVPGSELRSALREGGYQPLIYRVDFEPALVAALPRRSYDLVLLDSKTTSLSPSAVHALMGEHGIRVPLVVLAPGRDILADVREALDVLRN